MIYKIQCHVFVEAPEDHDPEDIAQTFNDGMTMALEDYGTVYDGREVLRASVEQIEVASDQEIEDAGLTE